MIFHLRALILALVFPTALLAQAQGSQVAFGGLRADTSAPVEVTADSLNVNQTDGSAEFSGQVRVGQGDMRLSADKVLVIYRDGGKGIERLDATGNVVLVSGADAAEAQRAQYTIDSGIVVLTGDVLLVQGGNALTSERMEVNLTDGTAKMDGRVRTVIQPEKQ